jgi:putative phosphoribosyl transferase
VPPFRDRADAGRQLADRLTQYAHRSDVLVLGLLRGGTPVAAEIAARLKAPLDVFLVRKLGVPSHPELAMGAIAEGGVQVLSQSIIRDLEIPAVLVEQVAVRERLELERRASAFRTSGQPPAVSNRIVIVVDDGLATGASMEAAILALRSLKPARIVVAVPVGARETCDRIRAMADELVALAIPDDFRAVGLWYEDFDQTTDEEVIAALATDATPTPVELVRRHAIRVPIDAGDLPGDLAIPVGATGLVLFAHGSGSSRHSPRNQLVARALERHGLGTLLIDLLTPDEDAIDRRTAGLRFDIGLLASRLVRMIDWLGQDQHTAALRIGLFGASTGGGAALVAAADRPARVAAVVSRGGRPDLANGALPRVQSPTLLIVGGDDAAVIHMNETAMRRMRSPVTLRIIAGATQLFEQPGALDQVADLAGEWFGRYLSVPDTAG